MTKTEMVKVLKALTEMVEYGNILTDNDNEQLNESSLNFVKNAIADDSWLMIEIREEE